LCNLVKCDPDCKLKNEWIVTSWLTGKKVWILVINPGFMRRLTLFAGATAKNVSECNLQQSAVKPGMKLM